MTRSTVKPRPYMSADHLRGLATSEAGSIMVRPLRATDIYFDAARSNYLPANLPEGEHGSTVLDIGRGVQVRASGNASRVAGDEWVVTHLHANQYPSGRELTSAQEERTRGLIGDMLTEWAGTHAGDIAQADDIDRNNAAQGLEEQIAKHEQALDILRGQLAACDEGEPFTEYPDLPTKRR